MHRAWSPIAGCAIVAPMCRRVLWLSLCVVWLTSLGCGRDLRLKQAHEPCTRTAQCASGLVCLVGVCLPVPDAGPDAGPDGGTDAGV